MAAAETVVQHWRTGASGVDLGTDRLDIVPTLPLGVSAPTGARPRRAGRSPRRTPTVNDLAAHRSTVERSGGGVVLGPALGVELTKCLDQSGTDHTRVEATAKLDGDPRPDRRAKETGCDLPCGPPALRLARPVGGTADDLRCLGSTQAFIDDARSDLALLLGALQARNLVGDRGGQLPRCHAALQVLGQLQECQCPGDRRGTDVERLGELAIGPSPAVNQRP